MWNSDVKLQGTFRGKKLSAWLKGATIERSRAGLYDVMTADGKYYVKTWAGVGNIIALQDMTGNYAAHLTATGRDMAKYGELAKVPADAQSAAWS